MNPITLLLSVLPLIVSGMNDVADPRVILKIKELEIPVGKQKFGVKISIINKENGIAKTKFTIMDVITYLSKFYSAFTLAGASDVPQEMVEVRPTYKGIAFAIQITLLGTPAPASA